MLFSSSAATRSAKAAAAGAQENPLTKRRVTVCLSEPSDFAHAATFCDERGGECVQLCDLSDILNSLMFSCAVHPGLSHVLLELLDFAGAALRTRSARIILGGPTGKVRTDARKHAMYSQGRR